MRCLLFNQCPQQFVRDNVLHVDGGGDEEVAAAQRDLRGCPVHEVVDRALNDPKRDSVFEASVEEDDKVNLLSPLFACQYHHGSVGSTQLECQSSSVRLVLCIAFTQLPGDRWNRFFERQSGRCARGNWIYGGEVAEHVGANITEEGIAIRRFCREGL